MHNEITVDLSVNHTAQTIQKHIEGLMTNNADTFGVVNILNDVKTALEKKHGVMCTKCQGTRVEVQEHPNEEVDARNYYCHDCGHSGSSEENKQGGERK